MSVDNRAEIQTTRGNVHEAVKKVFIDLGVAGTSLAVATTGILVKPSLMSLTLVEPEAKIWLATGALAAIATGAAFVRQLQRVGQEDRLHALQENIIYPIPVSSERERGGFESRWYNLRREGVQVRASVFYRDFKIQDQLKLANEQGDLFRTYFAGYVALKEGLPLPPSFMFLNSPMMDMLRGRSPLLDRVHGILDVMSDVNNEIGKGLLTLAESKSEDIRQKVRDIVAERRATNRGLGTEEDLGNPAEVRNAANLLSAVHLENIHRSKQKQLDAVSSVCLRIKIGVRQDS